MSDYDNISAAVDLAIKTANYNKQNNILRPDDEGNLKHMSNELEKKIKEFETEKERLDMCLNGGNKNEIFS